MSRRQAAEHFEVGTSSAIRWVAQALTTGDIADKPRRRSALGCDRGRGRFHPFPARLRRGPHPARDALRPGGQGPIVQHRPIVELLRSKRDHAKKVRARGRARASGYPETPPGMVRDAARSRSGKAGLHRRDLGLHKHSAKLWPRSAPGPSTLRFSKPGQSNSSPLPADRRCRRHGQFIQPQRSARQSAD